MNPLPVPICVLLLLPSVHSLLPAPVNVTLTSENFHNVLHWSPGPGTPPGTRYMVYTWVNGKLKKPKLVSSTSLTLKLDLFPKHTLSVTALYNNSKSLQSSKVNVTPYEQTSLGPPSLTLTKSGSNLQINLSLPDADPHSNISDIQNFCHASFEIVLSSAEGKDEMKTKNRSVTLKGLKASREYCVKVRLETVLNPNTPWSQKTCIVTEAENVSKVAMVMRAVVPILVSIIIFLSLLLCGLWYTGICGKPKVPLLDMLKKPKAEIYEAILKPGRTHVDPICGVEDLEEKSNVYIRLPTSQYTALSSGSVEETSGRGTSESSGTHPEEVGPEDVSVLTSEMDYLSSDAEEEPCRDLSEEDIVELFSVTIAALNDTETLLPQPSTYLDSHDKTLVQTQAEYEGYEDDSEQESGCSGYMARASHA